MNILNIAMHGDVKSLHTQNIKNNKKKVAAASAIGSAMGIASAVAGIYKFAKKGNFSNITYNEKDIIIIGAGSVIGGLTGGLLTDENKANKVPKLREASQQFFGSLLCPIGILAVAENALEKSGFKMPLLKGTEKNVKRINILLEALPRIAVIAGSLVAGMNIGNSIMNKINNKIFGKEVDHEVQASDYLVHTDDVCVAASLLLKDSKSFSAVTSKILPASFILAGAKAGMQEA